MQKRWPFTRLSKRTVLMIVGVCKRVVFVCFFMRLFIHFSNSWIASFLIFHSHFKFGWIFFSLLPSLFHVSLYPILFIHSHSEAQIKYLRQNYIRNEKLFQMNENIAEWTNEQTKKKNKNKRGKKACKRLAYKRTTEKQ